MHFSMTDRFFREGSRLWQEKAIGEALGNWQNSLSTRLLAALFLAQVSHWPWSSKNVPTQLKKIIQQLSASLRE